IKQHDQVVADIPVDALVEEVPVYNLPAKEAGYFQEFQQKKESIPSVENHGEVFKKILAQPSISSKEAVYSQYESEVLGNTVQGPGSSAAVVQIEGTEKAIAIATDCNSRYIYLDPQTGGKIAVAETARNIVCTGAKPLAITDGLNFGDPTNPEVFWQMEQSIDGISEACNIFKTPVVSGNVCIYNQSKGMDSLPTRIIIIVCLLDYVEADITYHIQSLGFLIYLIGEIYGEFCCSKLKRMTESKYLGKL